MDLRAPLLPCPGGICNCRPLSDQAFQPRSDGNGLAPPKHLAVLRDLDLYSDGAIATRPGAETQQVLTAGRRLIAAGGMLLVHDGVALRQVPLMAWGRP